MRARRQPRRGLRVVGRRRRVVRRVRVEERGEVLDLPAARAELELAAAVDRDACLGAVVVRVEEPLDAPEARRLEVERPRREGQADDVGDGVDRRIPGDPLAVRLEDGIRLVVQRGILQPRLRKGERDARVEGRIRRLVDRRSLVGALEVERVDRAGLDELVDQSVVPRRLSGRASRAGRDRDRARRGAARSSQGRRTASTRRSGGAWPRARAPRRATCPPGEGRGRAPRSRTPSGDTGGTGREPGRRARATGARRAPRRSRRCGASRRGEASRPPPGRPPDPPGCRWGPRRCLPRRLHEDG